MRIRRVRRRIRGLRQSDARVDQERLNERAPTKNRGPFPLVVEFLFEPDPMPARTGRWSRTSTKRFESTTCSMSHHRVLMLRPATGDGPRERLMKNLLLGMIAALTFSRTAQTQTTGDEVFAAYCIGVLQVNVAHSLLWKSEITGYASFLDNRVKQLRTFLLRRNFYTGEHNTLELSLEAGLDDAGECYKTGRERSATCYGEGQRASSNGVTNQSVYDACQRRLEPENCRRSAKCDDLSRLSTH